MIWSVKNILTNINDSINSFHLVQDSIEPDFLSIKRKLTDVMFILDIFNDFIIYPKILGLIGFRITR